MSDGRSSVVLLSGGLDSSVAFAMEHDAGRALMALTMDYGQRAAPREIESARRLAARFDASHEVVALPFFRELPAGALLDPDAPMPSPTDADIESNAAALEDSARQVWVPNRNGVLVNVAAAYAEARGATRVVVGFNREEAATFADNSAAFLEALNRGLRFSTRNAVKVASPTVDLDKREILARGLDLGLDPEAMWPCYEGAARRCERCESCRRFARARRAVGDRRPPTP